MDILQHIRAEMIVVIVPALTMIGKFLKDWPCCKDKYIPIILSPLSVLFSVAWILIYTPENIYAALFDGVIQGIMLAGMAVYGNQIVRQLQKDKDEDE